jgi:4-carboxymuconolactone decarboxylase
MKVRRSVLGDAHVDRAEKNKTAVDADFQRYITEAAWNDVWGRPELDQRTRSLLTIVLLAALGHHEELAMHYRATKNTGASLSDIREALMHVSVYAGVPAANRAFAILKEVVSEQGHG